MFLAKRKQPLPESNNLLKTKVFEGFRAPVELLGLLTPLLTEWIFLSLAQKEAKFLVPINVVKSCVFPWIRLPVILI